MEFNLIMILFPDWSMLLIGMNRRSTVIRSKMLQIPIALPAESEGFSPVERRIGCNDTGEQGIFNEYHDAKGK